MDERRRHENAGNTEWPAIQRGILNFVGQRRIGNAECLFFAPNFVPPEYEKARLDKFNRSCGAFVAICSYLLAGNGGTGKSGNFQNY